MGKKGREGEKRRERRGRRGVVERGAGVSDDKPEVKGKSEEKKGWIG